MTESLITHLRHVDLAIPDYERQLGFYTQVWGLTEVAADNGISFLAAGDVLEGEITGLGLQRNHCVSQQRTRKTDQPERS